MTYVYDSIGNRIQRLYWNGSVTVDERFAQDGWDTNKPGAVGNENFDVILDLNSTNGLVNRRLYGDGQDDLIAKQSSVGVVTWYLTDRLGSVQSLVDNSGISVGTLAYSAFGSTTTNVGATDRYQYTGREWDAALGLQFNRDRMYISSSGRWLSEDPSSFSAGDPNLMRYVGNGPTNGRDPSGNAWIEENCWWDEPLRDFAKKLGERKNGPYVQVGYYELASFGAGKRAVLYVPREEKERFKAAIKEMWALSDADAEKYAEIAVDGKSSRDNIVLLKDGSIIFQHGAEGNGNLTEFDEDNHRKVEGVLRHRAKVYARRQGEYSGPRMDLAPPSSEHEAAARHASDLAKRLSDGIDARDPLKCLTVIGESGGAFETMVPGPGPVRRGKAPVMLSMAADRTGPRGQMTPALQAPKLAISEALEKGEIHPTSKQRAGAARPPRHHIYPQAEREWFKERGVNIDDFTVELDEGTHTGLHFNGSLPKGGGWWNSEIMKALTEREAILKRRLTPEEIQEVGKEMRTRAKIIDLPIIPFKDVSK